MLYSQIALALEEISQSSRSGKVDKTAAILSQALEEPEMLFPVVRLLSGELWPRWEGREMGIGPEAVAEALADLCDMDISAQRQKNGEMGRVAEAALQHKGQNSLSCQPLDALSVYDGLQRISTLRGRDSEQRKIAILRGIFLAATPLEGKFIARTALRSMQAGLGPQTMISAISSALACDLRALGEAYGLLPDLGSIADLARRREMDRISVRSMLPARFMIYPQREEVFFAAYLPKYPGLRVQVHKRENEVRIFTSQLREISLELSGLCRDIGQLEADFVADADLIGFFESAGRTPAKKSICSRMEMLRYLNRRRLTRKSNICPALLAYDLLAREERDICGMAYVHRRARLLESLGQPKALPFSGISPAEERLLRDRDEVDDYLCQVEKLGAAGLLSRDPESTYHPGEVAERDFMIRAAHNLSAIVVEVQWTESKKREPRPRYQVALREGEGFVPVGWVWRARSDCNCQSLNQAARSLKRYKDAMGAGIASQILLQIRIRGAKRDREGLRIIEPVIEGFILQSSPEDSDSMEKLEKICRE